MAFNMIRKARTIFSYHLFWNIADLVSCTLFRIAINERIRPYFEEHSMDAYVGNANHVLRFFLTSGVVCGVAIVLQIVGLARKFCLSRYTDVSYEQQTAEWAFQLPKILFVPLIIIMTYFGVTTALYTIVWWWYFRNRDLVCEARYSLAMYLVCATMQLRGLFLLPDSPSSCSLNGSEVGQKRREESE